MHLRLSALLIACFATFSLAAQEGYAIEVEIEGYEEEYLTLANYLLDKQYIVDTAYRNEAGAYVFRSDTAALPRGIYLVVLAPDNQYFQLLIGDDPDQAFTLSTHRDELGKITATGSRENELFYDYLAFIDRMQAESAPLREVLADSTADEAAVTAARTAMTAFDDRVAARQDATIAEHPNSFVAAIIRANRPLPPPEFAEIADEEERRNRQWRWLQRHYFDPIDLEDDRLLRTPFLFQRIDYFVNKLHVRHPDTISQAIDTVLDRMAPTSELFKHYTVHFLNEAAKSNLVGMDAVYVHLVDKYYGGGKAYWADEAQTAKLVENANRTRPLLIGKIAPDIQMTRRDGTPISLYDIDTKYTVLYFWKYDCGSCKKSTPQMAEFYEKWRERGVTIFAVCTKGADEIPACWEYVEEQGIGDWVHTSDPYQRYYRSYDITSTPTIFVLDADKKIVSKRIGAQQLDELLTMLERDAAAGKAGKK